MKYRLIKYTQGTKVWYEIQEFKKFNWIGRLYYGFDGRWEEYYTTDIFGCRNYFRYYDEETARLKFYELEQDYLDKQSEIKEEILGEF